MFTGLVERVGAIAGCQRRGGDLRLVVDTGSAFMAGVALGDSIAVNGVCLTAVELQGDRFVADVSLESLAHTCIGDWKPGAAVNLEKACMPSSRLGGHLVSGHVDGVGVVRQLRKDARSLYVEITPPPYLLKYLAVKGSVTVDGVSLTINRQEGETFSLNIVPHTAEETTIKFYKPGRSVHLEVDQVARYLEQLLRYQAGGESGESADNQASSKSPLTKEFLSRHGFS